VRVPVGDPFAEHRLDPRVCLGHGGVVRLAPHLELAPEDLQADLRGLVGQIVGEGQLPVPVGHRRGYLTMSESTNRTPEPLVKLARSSVEACIAGLAMSILKSSRESHVRTASPSYGASPSPATRVTMFTS